MSLAAVSVACSFSEQPRGTESRVPFAARVNRTRLPTGSRTGTDPRRHHRYSVCRIGGGGASGGRCRRRGHRPRDAVLLSRWQTELTGYVRNLVAQLPLPLILYNMPSLTKVWFEIETLERLADIVQIVGVKDSSAIWLTTNACRRCDRDARLVADDGA